MWPTALSLVRLVHLLAILPSSPLVQSSSFTRSLTPQAFVSSRWYNLLLHGFYPQQSFKSSKFSPPRLNFNQWDDRCDEGGYTLITPRGPMVPQAGPVMLDTKGNLIWMEDKYGQATDFKIQHHNGQEYLTFWTGEVGGIHGIGVYYMLDSSYQVYKVMTPAGSMKGDLHEFKITENGTALMTIYEPKAADLSAFGITSEGWIYDSIFQEVDIETGELLFEWRASDHYPVDDTLRLIGDKGQRPENALDYFHINSIDKDPSNGNYLVSARYLHAISCISPTGTVLWTLGGRSNDFTDLSSGAATDFSWQHHATFRENNTITFLDNGKFNNKNAHADHSSGLLVSYDPENMTVALLQTYLPPSNSFLVASQGSIQRLSSGNVLIGWGHHAAYSEYTSDGVMLCHANIAPSLIHNLGWVTSYRTHRSDHWIGRPSDPPDVYLKGGSDKIYVSWNGATEVKEWLLQGADEGEALETSIFEASFTNITAVDKGMAFETSLDLNDDMPTYFRVAAVDSSGSILGYTRTVHRRLGNVRTNQLVRVLMILTLVSLGVMIGCLIWWFRATLLCSTVRAIVSRIDWVAQVREKVGQSGRGRYSGLAMEEEAFDHDWTYCTDTKAD